MYLEITSAQNERIKSVKKSIAEGKDSGVMLIEGEKPVLLPVGAKTLVMVSRSRDAFSAVAGL